MASLGPLDLEQPRFPVVAHQSYSRCENSTRLRLDPAGFRQLVSAWHGPVYSIASCSIPFSSVPAY